MTSLIIAGIVIVLVVTLLIKGFYPQAALFIGGLALLGATAAFDFGEVLSADKSTNFAAFDVFKAFCTGFSSRIAGLGLTLMAIGGFSRYMEYVGASGALFSVFERPLSKIKSPYVLLAAAFLASQCLVVFIPSHAGLALLLMVMLYPILIRSGVSPLSALGVIGCCQFMDVGPGAGSSILAAQIAGMDVSEYFVYYQMPLWLGMVVIMTFVVVFVQCCWDRYEGWTEKTGAAQAQAARRATGKESDCAPRIYAVLPVIPLILIICFSKVAGSSIRMDVLTAMVISTCVAILFELIRHRNLRTVLASFQNFFDGMGKILVGVVSLIVCGEFFASGIIKSGALATLIAAADSAGFGLGSMVFFAGLLMIVMAFIMGSGNAAFFSFAPLTPDIAAALGVPVIILIFPMQIFVSYGRAASPITGAIIAVAGMAGYSPFQVAKRTCIPMGIAVVLTYIYYYIVF